MKRALVVVLVGAVALAGRLLYEKVSAGHVLGPASLALLGLLGAVALLAGVTLLLYDTPRRGTLVKLWLALASFGVTYVVADLALGMILIDRLSPPIVPDPYRHHRLAPGTRSEFKGREFHYTQRVNDLGLRGPDRPARKPAGRYRIVMLGDSFTMGKGVGDDETFSARLETALAVGRGPGQPVVEVLNAGVDSYAPILSLLQLTRDLAPLEPDMVILNLDVSDLAQETAYRRKARVDAEGRILGVEGTPHDIRDEPPLIARAGEWVDRHLFLTRLVLLRIEILAPERDVTVRRVAARVDPELVKHTLADDTADRSGQWRALFDSILRIKSYCEARGIRFLLTVYPWGHQVNDREWVPGRLALMPRDAVVSDRSLETIRRWAGANHVELLDLFPAFRAYRGPAPLYFREDMHWTSAGHALVARELERYVRAEILPGLPSGR